MSWSEINSLFETSLENETFLSATFSNPRNNNLPLKISARVLQFKKGKVIQNTQHFSNNVKHENYPINSWNGLTLIKDNYRQALIKTVEGDFQILVSQSGIPKLLKKPPSKSALPLLHNRSKNYLLQEGESIPFLVELGVMNTSGKVRAEKRDKFKQINRFLEIIRDILPHFQNNSSLRILDFGCGKSYLTFALYHYLVNILEWKIEIVGLDLKKEVIEKCQNLAYKLEYEGLTFQTGDIAGYNGTQPFDLVVSLHACDTATDAAIAKAIQGQVKVILAVPCCQHEFFKQIHNESLKPILKHGILKERFAALATDAARAELLEMHGYDTQVMEFIDLEHTPKNLLIRAVLSSKRRNYSSYLQFKETLHFDAALERYLKKD